MLPSAHDTHVTQDIIDSVPQIIDEPNRSNLIIPCTNVYIEQMHEMFNFMVLNYMSESYLYHEICHNFRTIDKMYSSFFHLAIKYVSKLDFAFELLKTHIFRDAPSCCTPTYCNELKG